MSWDDVGPNHCHMDGTPIVRVSREKNRMAKYDYGGGCTCGLYRECIDGCVNAPSPRELHQKTYTYSDYTVEKVTDMNEDDFGFSIVDEKDLASTDTKAQQLHDMIMPLLKNLKANPDKDIIKWNGADRVKRIDDFIRKMDNVLNS
jgi:hypothetical protein